MLPLYKSLLNLVKGKEYFVITTNVDHQFQLAGFDKQRLYYTQGDYGLFQCSEPCHYITYDNKEIILKMINEQQDDKIPPSLIPRCPICGKPMTMNLRSDNNFVEEEWHKARERYLSFLKINNEKKVIFLELGVGYNTPGIIKYPYMQMTYDNKNAKYIVINNRTNYVPSEIEKRSLVINDDINRIIEMV